MIRIICAITVLSATNVFSQSAYEDLAQSVPKEAAFVEAAVSSTASGEGVDTKNC